MFPARQGPLPRPRDLLKSAPAVPPNSLEWTKTLPEDFHGLGLSAKVTDAVAAAGYTKPTDIQAKAIPHRPSKSGTSSALRRPARARPPPFVLPMLTLLESGRARARMPRTLILEPTRELAAQVHENFEKYGKNHKLERCADHRRRLLRDQNKKLDRGADVLIATPGRLLDQFERGRILMNGVEILVIDEADRMLDMGFIPDIEQHLRPAPRRAARRCSSRRPWRPKSRSSTGKFLRDPVQDRSRAAELDRRDHRPAAGPRVEQARGKARRAARS